MMLYLPLLESWQGGGRGKGIRQSLELKGGSRCKIIREEEDYLSFIIVLSQFLIILQGEGFLTRPHLFLASFHNILIRKLRKMRHKSVVI